MIATMTATKKMKAIVCEKPGPVSRLMISEINQPAMSDDGVLVRVHASSANPVDLFPTSAIGYLQGGRKPAVLGTDFAGTVDQVGAKVGRFKAGDEVFGGKRGAFAEYLLASEVAPMVSKPAGVSFEAAGTVAVAGTTALQALRTHGDIKTGQHVLINGASGGVGTFAVQIAKALGAEVTAVCSARNVDLVRSLGADTVIDYTMEDFTRGSRRFDLVLDVAGSHSLAACRGVMTPTATFVGVGAAGIQHRSGGNFRAIGHFLGTRVASIGGKHKVVVLFIAALNNDDLTFLGELLESGKVVPAIDRRYDLSGVPEALEYMNRGHARAKVAIRVGSDE
jgi:NADPH:quinone reductase-like Zn-dependent oxidoreductase